MGALPSTSRSTRSDKLVDEHGQQQRLCDQEQHHPAQDGHHAEEETARATASGLEAAPGSSSAGRANMVDSQRHTDQERDQHVPLERVLHHVETSAKGGQKTAEESHGRILTHTITHAATKQIGGRPKTSARRSHVEPEPERRFPIRPLPRDGAATAGSRSRHPPPPDRAAGGAVSVRAGGRRLAADERRRGRDARRRQVQCSRPPCTTPVSVRRRVAGTAPGRRHGGAASAGAAAAEARRIRRWRAWTR